MARPKQPTNVLEMKGAFKKNPNRRNAEEPKPERALGDAPSGLSPGVLACWNELIENAAPGVLTCSDRTAVELTAKLLSKFRDDSITTAETGQLIRLLSQLGMTPADRSKIHVKTPGRKENPFD